MRFIEFSEQLKNKGIISTYKAFCDSVSIAPQVYNDIKAGRRSVTFEIIINTCYAYNLSSDFFLFGEKKFILEPEEAKSKLPVAEPGSALSGLTDDMMLEKFNAYLLEQFETGRIVSAVTVRQYQNQIWKLTAQVMRLKYINKELTLKLQMPRESGS